MDGRQVMNKFFALVATIGLSLPIYAGIPLKTQFSGKFVDPAGEPIEGTISIRLDLVPSSYPTCLLYRETQSYAVGADGLINIVLGAGATTVGTFASSLFMNESALTCLTAAGLTAGTQSVSSSEARKLYVYIDGEAYGAIEMVSVPYAIKAAKADMAISVQAQSISNLSLAGITTNCTNGQTIVFDGSGNFSCHSLTGVNATTIGSGNVTNTELDTLDGVSTPIQTSFSYVAATAAAIGTTVNTVSGAIVYATATANGITITKTGNYIEASIHALGVTNAMLAPFISAAKIGSTGNVVDAEFDYLDGVTSSIQTQLNTITTNRNYSHLILGTPTNAGTPVAYFNGSIAGATNVSADVDDNIIQITGATVTQLDLPDPTLIPGRQITVLNAMTANSVTVATSVGFIRGVPAIPYQTGAMVVSDGANWFVIGN